MSSQEERAQRRRHAIAKEHAENPHPHLELKRLKAHLLIHDMVEQQLEAGHPSEVLDALRRLTGGGLSRHEAVHAIGALVAKEAFAMLRDKRPFDEDAYKSSLKQLTVKNARQLLGTES